MLVVLFHIPPCYLSGVTWKWYVSEKCHVSSFLVLLHIHPCYLTGVAWKNGMLVKKCHVSGFAPYSLPETNVAPENRPPQ